MERNALLIGEKEILMSIEEGKEESGDTGEQGDEEDNSIEF